MTPREWWRGAFLATGMAGPRRAPEAGWPTGLWTAPLSGACLVAGSLAARLDLLDPAQNIWFVWTPLFAAGFALRK